MLSYTKYKDFKLEKFFQQKLFNENLKNKFY